MHPDAIYLRIDRPEDYGDVVHELFVDDVIDGIHPGFVATDVTGDVELALAERSSALEAATLLMDALGINSGGLASMTLEIIRQRDALRQRCACCQEINEDGDCGKGCHCNTTPSLP